MLKSQGYPVVKFNAWESDYSSEPLIGFIAAGVAQMAVKGGPFRRLGRWAPLAALLVLLVLVIANVMLAKAV